MLESVSRRILTLVQLTRMALVFTAISDSLCALMLWSRWNAADGEPIRQYLTWPHAFFVVGTSIGLYGFGMSLNDIIDRRRDTQIASDRPLPSGRIGVGAAHIVCGFLALLAIVCGVAITQFPNADNLSLVLVIWTGLLVAFYDFAGKYLVAPGLLTLGLIRFFHAAIAAPRLPLLWHPLLLLNHVTLLSAVAYRWEAKRPAMTRGHWWALLAGLGMVDLLCIFLVGIRRQRRFGGGFAEALWITPGLTLPAVAAVLFLIVAVRIRLRANRATDDANKLAATQLSLRRAGQTLTLFGLLWMIVYDASFAAAYVNWLAALAILMLLPLAYLSVRMTRWWSKFMTLSQPIEFQRVR